MTRTCLVCLSLSCASLAGCRPALAVDAASMLAPDAPAAPLVDAGPFDGGSIECDGLFELGHCRLAVTGLPCTGQPDEPVQFVGAAAGAGITVVRGPQGALMLALAGRTRGIEPGDPERPADSGNPVLDIHVADEIGVEVASYRGRAAFVPDASDPTLLVRREIFVITETSLAGALVVHGTVRDRNGIEHCGRLDVTIAR